MKILNTTIADKQEKQNVRIEIPTDFSSGQQTNEIKDIKNTTNENESNINQRSNGSKYSLTTEVMISYPKPKKQEIYSIKEVKQDKEINI